MSEPERWMAPNRLIDASDNEFERAILRAGRSLAGSSGRELRVLAALGVGTAIAVGSKASFAMAAGWKKFLVGGAIACGGATGVVAYQAVSTPTPDSSIAFTLPGVDLGTDEALPLRDPPGVEPSSAQLDEAERAAIEQESIATPEDAFAEEGDLVEAQTARRRVTGPRRAKEVPTEKAPVSALNEELALLDSARGALGAGRAGDALRRLDEHATRFPKGRLRLEAEVLRVQALAASGQKEEASRRAQRVLSRSPNSVVAARLRRYVIE